MVARCHILYLLAPPVLFVVAVVGLLTAIYAASIGLVQNDIKRVLAYSTISQLGYMFLGCGVAAFSASIFHLMTHAFFKALLFLAAGSVIHGLAEEQDMRRMGGVYPYMKATAVTFWVAALAISALPPLSGFFSKDEILWRAFGSGSSGPLFWAVGVITGAMTAFYVARVGIKTFHGAPRWASNAGRHPHESPLNMTLPMAALATLAAAGGLVGIPRLLGGGDHLGRFLEPVFAGPLLPRAIHSPLLESTLMAAAVTFSLGGILAAVYFYAWRPELPGVLKERFRKAYLLLLNKYYVDEAYTAGVVRPGERMANYVSQRLDMEVVDGAVNGIATLVNQAGLRLRRWQTGLVRNYALTILVAIVLVLIYSILLR
jgi:NADH-quinone oxidoreductase subunit L